MDAQLSCAQQPHSRLQLPQYVVEPSSSHTHSLILLHGLGSNGQKFGQELIEAGVCSDDRRLPELFPGARFIFPSSKWRRSSAFGRALLTQWFDIASVDDMSHRIRTQLRGLAESSQEILALIEEEAAKVPRENIILGGISQGCATALVYLLLTAKPVGGFVGMSGWLPFREDIEELVNGQGESNSVGGEEDNPFRSSVADTHEHQELVAVIQDWVKSLLFPRDSDTRDESPTASTPVFLGHGDVDEKVKHSEGEDACRTLRHWYKIPDEIDDVVGFLVKKCGWELDKQ